MTIPTQTVPLSKLRPGHEYPGESVNSRKVYGDKDIASLAASLREEGQLKPLLVCTHPKMSGVFFVFDGNRRLSGFVTFDGEPEVEVKNFGAITPSQALSKSWAANEAIPLHPADRSEIFAKLNDKGDDEAKIAERYGITVLAVKQHLAIGKTIAPELLTAWRNGDLTREAIELFTLCDDFEKQLDAFNDLKQDWMWQHNKEGALRDLRRKLMRNKEPVMKRLLGFIGTDSYRAAGGEIKEDFFGSGGNVRDMKLLNNLAKKKLDAEVERLLADGWSWAEGKMTTTYMHHGYGTAKAKPEYTEDETKRLASIKAETAAMDGDDESDAVARSFEKLEQEQEIIEQGAMLRAFGAKQKAKAGVIVSLRDDGTLHFNPGLIRKDEPKDEKKVRTAYQTPEQPITYQARKAISDWQNEAASGLLAQHPSLAFAAFLAAVGQDRFNASAPIHPDMACSASPVTKAKGFAAAFAEIGTMPIEDMVKLMGKVAAECVDLHDHRGGIKVSAAPIVEIIGADNFQAEIAKKFDPKVYFTGASKRHILGVYAEAYGEEDRKSLEGKKDAELVKSAIADIKKTGWLPPELRTSHYDGPGAKAAKPAAEKKAKAPKAKRAA